MYDFKCNNKYEEYLKQYEKNIMGRFGVSSPSAEREIICMADQGNSVSCKLYADMIFYNKIIRKNRYGDAFKLYLKSAGITVDESGEWKCSEDAYPLSFWIIGYYLVNYRRETILQKCDEISEIEKMTLAERMENALALAAVSLDYVDAPGAINLIGRILYEISEDKELFEQLHETVSEYMAGHSFDRINMTMSEITSAEEYRDLAGQFFVKAAEEGYVYGCNSLAAKEAAKIIDAFEEKSAKIDDYIKNYISYLKLAADRLEPYAANRLGLFYMTGEIKSGDREARFRDYTDRAKAKEYFIKATQYPDANAAWGYFNLIKYFYNDYDNNIELMNEHMDYIKELNPEVYGQALDL